jgi:hypothetical protein
MGGSHREAAEVVALGQEPKRRDLRWWEPARWVRRWWRRRGAQAQARAWNGTKSCAGIAEGEMGGSAQACHAAEGEREK